MKRLLLEAPLTKPLLPISMSAVVAAAGTAAFVFEFAEWFGSTGGQHYSYPESLLQTCELERNWRQS